jgi:hypothetical protein
MSLMRGSASLPHTMKCVGQSGASIFHLKMQVRVAKHSGPYCCSPVFDVIQNNAFILHSLCMYINTLFFFFNSAGKVHQGDPFTNVPFCFPFSVIEIISRIALKRVFKKRDIVRRIVC